MNAKTFSNLATSVKQAGSIKRGTMSPAREATLATCNVRAIREKLKKSVPEFASMIGVSVATLQSWEEG